MSVFSDIIAFRKQGDLEKAYAMATTALAENPDNVWVKRAMAWVLYDYINYNALLKNRDLFVQYLSELKDLNLPETEDVVYNAILWALRKFYSDCSKNEWRNNAFYASLFDVYREMPFPKGDAYLALLNEVFRARKYWEDYPKFLEWWDVDNFSEKDFEPIIKEDKKIMSLAERCYIELGKYYEKSEPSEQKNVFIEKLKVLVAQRNDLTYPPYYLAKLLIQQGSNQEAIDLLKSFVRKKTKEFWVWQLFGEAYVSDNEKLAFYCKALLCGGKEEMLVSLREKSALLFVQLGYYNEARFEIDKVISIRLQKNWKVSSTLENIRRESWYSNAQEVASNNAFYAENAKVAEEIVFGVAKKYKVLVTSVNAQKGFISFLTEEKKSGFFKKTDPRLNVKQGDVLELAAFSLEEEKPSKVKEAKILNEDSHPIFFRDFEGIVHKKTNADFAFIDSVYVSSDLLKSVDDGVFVSGKAIISYEKKKDKWGWRALSLNVK